MPPPRAPSPPPSVEMPESLDPLSHLSHIFEKIRKQVIEWGEDANWKIDVFLLPNEENSLNSTGPAPGPSTPSAAMDTIAHDATPTGRMGLTLAVRQVREQQELLSRTIQDLDSIQRVSAKKERDAEARLDVERRIMERDALVLSQKWKDAVYNAMEKDREMRDVQSQLEAGTRLIRDRYQERRKRIEEQSVSLRGSSGREGAGLANTVSISSRTEPDQPPLHQHRHRHVHYHRHHHRHLTKRREPGTDSLDNLALLASQVLTREPLVISKKSQSANGLSSEPHVARVREYTIRPEKKRNATEDRDLGLQLRPVKRIDLTGLEDTAESNTSIDQPSQAQLPSSASVQASAITTNGSSSLSLKSIPNGREAAEPPSKRPHHQRHSQQHPQQQQHLSQPHSSRSSTSTPYHQNTSSSPLTSKSLSTSDSSGRPFGKYRR
ncbi:hypothetical protein EDD11_005100 [Mortierella claussenii]|nr:hypothetical protein EDD11_005100 [Mortierella claussenii]